MDNEKITLISEKTIQKRIEELADEIIYDSKFLFKTDGK